ncbi:MAG: sodium-dependent transporter [Fusobacteria bacterium]|nr:MAG: sodium-dependent transporter [Fusobacteriota bacterium]
MSTEENRGQWGSRSGFILAAIGSAIGLGNIWRFPYVAASNGGGAFLIPYLVALFTAGIPLLILEFAMGHKIRSSAPGVFAKLNRKYEAIGWFQTLIAFFITTYYVVIIAWSFSYMFFAFTGAWGSDPKAFLFGDYLNLTDAPLHLGGLNLKVAVPLLLVWAINYGVLRMGVKDGLEKANKVFMPLLIVALLVIVVRGVTLPGAMDGLDYFFSPDFSKLSDPNVWLAAYGQIFFSLSICFAIMYAYASYLPKKSDIVNNAFMTGLGNCSFSLISGIGVFSILGFMAHTQGVSVAEVSTAGVGLAFIVFPEAINQLPGMNGLIGAVFFITLIFAGLSSSMSIMEAVVAAIADKFNVTRTQALNRFAITSGILSLLVATDGGLYVLDIVDYATNQYGIVIAGILELLVLGWLFNLESVRKYVNELSDFPVGKWWIYAIKATSFILMIILALKIKGEIVSPYEGYSWTALAVYGLGVMVIITAGSFILSNKKASDEFEKNIYSGTLDDIKVED